MDLGAGANLRDFHRVAILPKHQQFTLAASSCPSNREGFHKDSLGGSGLSSFCLSPAADGMRIALSAGRIRSPNSL
jgi:hypothetical protein